MKILFVEDQLSLNIHRMIRLFSGYLGKKRENQLIALYESERGGSPQEIKKIVEGTDLIDVEYHFPDALRKVVNCFERYSLFIIDRNLAESDYEYNEVFRIDNLFSEQQYDKFYEREGDYLLQKLIYSGVDVMKQFYFLTAYPAQDEIRSGSEIKGHIEFGKFAVENLINKGNNTDIKKLQRLITENPILRLQAVNSFYFKVLSENIDNEAVDDFMTLLKKKDDTNRAQIKNNLTIIRRLYEKVLLQSSEIIPGMRENCSNEYDKIILGATMINWLEENRHINLIIKDFCFSIYKIASEFGPHPHEGATTDTVNSLLYALKDILRWFGGLR